MKGRRRNVIVVLTLLMSVVLAGCSVKIVPSHGAAGVVDPGRNLVTQERDGIRVSVQSMAWSGVPYYLDQYYTPFFVTVRNDRAVPLKLGYKAFHLVDNEGNQFDLIMPEKVWDILIGKQGPVVYMPPYPYSPYYYDRYRSYERYPMPPYPYYYPYYYPGGFYEISPADEYAWSHSKDIIVEGLTEGEVMPGAQVSGFIYFKRATRTGNWLELAVTLEGVNFEYRFDLIRQDRSGRSSRY